MGRLLPGDVGKRAYEQDAFSPENVGTKFKRLMGTSSPIEFKSATRSMSAEDASAEVLKTLLAQAKLAVGESEGWCGSVTARPLPATARWRWSLGQPRALPARPTISS